MMRNPAFAAGAALVWLWTSAPHAQNPPKLAVIIVVDQMRADFVERFRGDWTAGLKRLLTEGAWFREAAYPYLETVTCAGHATVATGVFPHAHGAFQNAWYDRQRGALVACTDDPQAKTIRYDEKSVDGGDSASRLLVPTFADRMRAERSAHVAAISIKDRSAIMLAGHGGDAVTWMSTTLDGWQTSTAFTSKPVAAVRDFINGNPIDADYGKVWTRLLPESHYRGVDDGVGEAPPPGWTPVFPHPLTSNSGQPDLEFHTKWERSPFGDAYLGRFAAALVQALGLGAHDTTDVLAIGFSSPDAVGHAFGPRSQEVQDLFAHLDRTLGTLLDRLDMLVGRGEYVVALTSDHGVKPLPEQLAAEGRDAGRVDVVALAQAIESRTRSVLGQGKYLASLSTSDVYFEPGVYDRLGATRGALDAVINAIEGARGVAKVFRSEQVREGAKAGDSRLRAAALSYAAGRSGDLVIVLKPGWMFAPIGTTHGSGTPDDQRVPIVLMGRGIKPGEYSERVTPADIAPTLAALSGTRMPQAEGRVLREALK